MINAGAITVHSLVGPPGLGPEERVARVVDGLSAFAGRRLEVDESVCASELENAHRNLAIAHMLRSHDVLTEDPETVVAGYTRQCSVLVTDPRPRRDGRDPGQPGRQPPHGRAGRP